jgi:hypothetical protein
LAFMNRVPEIFSSFSSGDKEGSLLIWLRRVLYSLRDTICLPSWVNNA